MQHRTKALLAILNQPLDYLHPQRGGVPPLLVAADARAVLNRMLLSGLGMSCPDPQQIEFNRWSDLWVVHWRRLPVIASLMGAQLLWPQLARGARSRELEASMRAFARADLGCRAPIVVNEEYGLEVSLGAVGLGALTAWREQIPEALMQRLLLQFSPQVVELQQTTPAQIPNPLLFILAVQHARIHQNAG
ncbi:hypothetical protein V8U11_06115 [Pseudomonas chlororaphis]|uniref:hypothetical protein n=1 Tax=Pseudomonas chlororaphis TaxID=587753 RepID=UPI0030CC6286